jgi:hypothetical protein
MNSCSGFTSTYPTGGNVSLEPPLFDRFAPGLAWPDATYAQKEISHEALSYHFAPWCIQPRLARSSSLFVRRQLPFPSDGHAWGRLVERCYVIDRRIDPNRHHARVHGAGYDLESVNLNACCHDDLGGDEHDDRRVDLVRSHHDGRRIEHHRRNVDGRRIEHHRRNVDGRRIERRGQHLGFDADLE